MTQLSSDLSRDFENEGFDSQPVKGGAIIYEGSAVGLDGNGYSRPLEAGDPFAGFCLRKIDNSAGSDGDQYVELIDHGKAYLSASTLTQADVGSSLYASDGNEFTKTETANSLIGTIKRIVSATECVVKFDV